MNYRLEAGKVSDAQQVYDLIDQRICWMDQVGLKQWNVLNYRERFTVAYYQQKARDGQLYVLKRETDGAVSAVGVLFETDDRWDNDAAPAYYLHQFAAAQGEAGAGAAMLDGFCRLAREHGKKYLRLDCAVNNEKLNRYYEGQGFCCVGTCVAGMYTGNLMEKMV